MSEDSCMWPKRVMVPPAVSFKEPVWLPLVLRFFAVSVDEHFMVFTHDVANAGTSSAGRFDRSARLPEEPPWFVAPSTLKEKSLSTLGPLCCDPRPVGLWAQRLWGLQAGTRPLSQAVFVFLLFP